jgi:hypothetical protein
MISGIDHSRIVSNPVNGGSIMQGHPFCKMIYQSEFSEFSQGSMLGFTHFSFVWRREVHKKLRQLAVQGEESVDRAECLPNRMAWKWCRDHNILAFRGMLETDASGVEQDGPIAVASPRAVLDIPHDWKPDGAELRPDLMQSSTLRVDFEQAVIIDVFQPLIAQFGQFPWSV